MKLLCLWTVCGDNLSVSGMELISASLAFVSKSNVQKQLHVLKVSCPTFSHTSDMKNTQMPQNSGKIIKNDNDCDNL